MFEEITQYLSTEEENLDFTDWTVKSGLVPNIKSKSDRKFQNSSLKEFSKNNTVITMEDDIIKEFNLAIKYDIGREYEALARVIITSEHVGRVRNTAGPLIPIPSALEKTHNKLAGIGAPIIAPGINLDNLVELTDDKIEYQTVQDHKYPANSQPVWILWHPKQNETIQNITFGQEKKRYLIQGPFGTGKTQILMYLALKSVMQHKNVCFWSMLPEANNYPFNRYIESICQTNKIHFIGGRLLGLEEDEEKIKTLVQDYDCVFVDEMKITGDPVQPNDHASAKMLR